MGMGYCKGSIVSRPEADLGMFSMFGRTGAPTKMGPPHEDQKNSATNVEIARKAYYCIISPNPISPNPISPNPNSPNPNYNGLGTDTLTLT